MRMLVVVLVLLSAHPTSAQRTLHVPSEYRTIQLAIHAASDRDTVLVAPGMYKEWDIDFLGKSILLKGSGGAALTTIDAGDRGYGIVCKSREPREAVVEGFTITNTDVAIYCWNSSPTLIRNRLLAASNRPAAIECDNASPEITQNTFSASWVRCSNRSSPGIKQNLFEYPDSQYGIFATDSSPIIEGNTIQNREFAMLISDNSTAVISDNFLSSNFSLMLAYGATARIANNVIILNRWHYRLHGIECWDVPHVDLVNNLICHNVDSSLYCKNSTLNVMNCTFAHNGASNPARGGAIYCEQGSRIDITNTLFWANEATAGKDIYIGEDTNPSTVTISHSNITSANVVTSAGSTLIWGQGNQYADPRFVDPGNHDYHLLADSPCIGKGTGTAPGVPLNDFEGDVRAAPGVVDIGADEFHPHLYHVGETSPGRTMQFNILGNPGQPVVLAYSGHPTPLEPPISIPGLSGELRLQFPIYLVPLGPIPRNGLLTLSLPLPPQLPRQTYPAQTLIGLHISNLDLVEVK